MLCDGRAEYFETARRAYLAAWPGARVEAATAVAAPFAAARPLVESGWEMPVLLHALAGGADAADLVDRRAWMPTARRLLAEAGLDAPGMARAVNEARDAWFRGDPVGWLRQHTFYPGLCARMVHALDTGVHVAVVTTKAERFARALLTAQDPRLAGVPIVGREPERVVGKPETLLRLAGARGLPPGASGLWFVEDLLETLKSVRATPGLDGARRYLAGWGYNTLEDRASAAVGGHATLLSLAAAATPFPGWPR